MSEWYDFYSPFLIRLTFWNMRLEARSLIGLRYRTHEGLTVSEVSQTKQALCFKDTNDKGQEPKVPKIKTDDF